MGKIFKTPKDDSVEETLRAMHLANTVDNVYEWGYGWIRTVVVAILSIFIVSGIESNSTFSLWDVTIEWGYQQIADFGSWLTSKFS